MIKAKNLTKIFNSGFLFTKNVVAAVDDVNFEIGKGEILALVGESGGNWSDRRNNSESFASLYKSSD